MRVDLYDGHHPAFNGWMVGIPEQDEVSKDIVLGRLRAFNGWACGIVWRQRSPRHVVGVSEMGAVGLPVTQLTAKEWLALPRCT